MENQETNEKLTFTHVELEGYRSIRHVEVDFHPGLNIIIGKNGSGKTNFFNFLDDALNFNYDDYDQFSSKLIFETLKTIELLASKEPNIQVENRSFENDIISNENINYKFKFDGLTIDINDKESLEITLRANGLMYQTNFFKHGISNELPFVDIPYTFSFNESARITSIFNFIGNTSNSFFIRTVFLNIFIDFIGLKDEIKNLTFVKSKVEDIFNSFIDQIKSDLIKFSPIQNIRLNENINIYYDKVNKEVICSNLHLEYQINGSWLPFSSLSDGTKRLFLLISDLTITNSYLIRKKSVGTSAVINYFPRIILIEEPELGIHPHQLHLLMTFLKEKSEEHQIILTTHSPQVLDVLGKDELDKIIICELIDKEGTKLRHLSSDEKTKATSYVDDGMYLSDYWRFSDFNRV